MQKMRLQSMLIRTTKGGSQIATPFGTKTIYIAFKRVLRRG